jgi:SAM-dependent methyltransferase
MSDYDRIGIDYRALRHPDPGIEQAIQAALDEAQTILNVGAGAGSYEPRDRKVVAVEPSATMIAQRPAWAAPVVQAAAEALPFADRQFDLALAILTLHHWQDLDRGLRELKRVAKRQMIFTWDPSHSGFWLTQEYFPEMLSIDQRIFPSFTQIEGVLGPMRRIAVPIPHDCTDGFGCAYWRRPEAYLDPQVRQAISTFHKIKGTTAGVEKLRDDLDSGRWEARYGSLRTLTSLDLGYTLLTN